MNHEYLLQTTSFFHILQQLDAIIRPIITVLAVSAWYGRRFDFDIDKDTQAVTSRQS